MPVIVNIPNLGDVEFSDLDTANNYIAKNKDIISGFGKSPDAKTVETEISEIPEVAPEIPQAKSKGRDFGPVISALHHVGRATGGDIAAGFIGALIDANLAPFQGKKYDIRDFGKSFERVAGKSKSLAKEMEETQPWASGTGKALGIVGPTALTHKAATKTLDALPWLAKTPLRGALTNIVAGQGMEGGKAEDIPLQAAFGAVFEPAAEGLAWGAGKVGQAATKLGIPKRANQALKAIKQLIGRQVPAEKSEAGAAIKESLFGLPEEAGKAHQEIIDKYFGGKEGKKIITKQPRAIINRISKDLKATGYLDKSGKVTGYADEYGIRGGPKLSKAAQDEAYNIMTEIGNIKQLPPRKGILQMRQTLQQGGKFGADVTTGSEAAYMRNLQRELNADIDAELERAIGKEARKEFQASRKTFSTIKQKTDEMKKLLGIKGDIDETVLMQKFLAKAKTNPTIAQAVRRLLPDESADIVRSQIIEDVLGNKAVQNSASEVYNIKSLIDRLGQSENLMSPYLAPEETNLIDTIIRESQAIGKAGGKTLAPEETASQIFSKWAENLTNVKAPLQLAWKAGARPLVRGGMKLTAPVLQALEVLTRASPIAASALRAQ